MQELDMDITVKVLVVGNGNCGKSSLLNKFTRNTINATHIKTIGTEFYEKDVHLHDTHETVKLLLWDTAGQDMFSEITRTYYTGAAAVVIVFSTVDRASFDAVETWYKRVSSALNNNESVVYVLMQNKIDLLSESCVSAGEVEALARKLNVKLYRACVKEGIQVNEVFDYVIDEFMARGDVHNSNTNALQTIDSYSVQHQQQAGSGVESRAGASMDKLLAGNGDAAGVNNYENLNRQNGSDRSADAQQQQQHNRKNSAVTETTGSQVSRPTGKLQPVTRRTGGKKKQECVIM